MHVYLMRVTGMLSTLNAFLRLTSCNILLYKVAIKHTLISRNLQYSSQKKNFLFIFLTATWSKKIVQYAMNKRKNKWEAYNVSKIVREEWVVNCDKKSWNLS